MNRSAAKPPTLDSLLKTTRDALLAGGRILRDGFERRRRVFFKTQTSPVTHIDMKAERAIIGLIRRRFPTHGFLAEESSYLNEVTQATRRRMARGIGRGAEATVRGGDRPPARWIIDPLDGTVNYLHGVPQSCVSVAVEFGGAVLAGGVYDPFRNELFLATRGGGATMNGKRIRVSTEKKLGRALLVTGFPYDHQENARFYLSFVEPFLRRSQDLRRLGSAALDLAWVACGRLEGFWEFKLNPWDVAAGWLLVTEAGGRVTDFSGRRADVNRPVETLASNGRLHAAMLRVFREARGGRKTTRK